MEKLTVVLATANPDKAHEIANILSSVPDLVLVPRPASVPDVEENGATLVENARLKAVALSTATGMTAVADDTGLAVDALGGAPGVYSARYSGEHATYADNVDKLVRELERHGALTPDERRATFRTVALVRFAEGDEEWAVGEVTGSIAPFPTGENGFGYDPVFVPDGGGGRTFAQMSAQEKHELSHRGRAFRALAELLDQGRLH